MPTLGEWLEASGLISIKIRLKPPDQTWRSLYATTEVMEWLNERANKREASSIGADLSIPEQLHVLFRRFILGQPLGFEKQFHAVCPGELAIWELKTPDVRIFGWFLRLDHFVAVRADFKDRIKDHGLLPGYRDEVARVRKELGGDEFCVWETGEHDVLSVRD